MWFLPYRFLKSLGECSWKLTQIVRFSEKSLLCNVSMKYVSGRLSLSGGLSYFSGHAPATLRYAALHSILQNRMQVVASASALRNTWISPRRRIREDTFIEHRNSKAFRLSEIRKWQDNVGVTSSRLFKKLRQKSYIHYGHKKYYGRNRIIGARSLRD